MPEQLTMPPWPRQHDLPPRWDGLPVEWGEWRDTADIFICPPPPPSKNCCHRCGSTKPRLMCPGRIFTNPGTVLAIRKAGLNRGRHLVANIAAFRCPDCSHDYVIDGIGPDGQEWDLDETDYTDDGSWEVGS